MNVGVITKDTAEAYHAVKALSNSGISRLLQTPAHFRAWQDGEAQKQTEAMAFGQMFHCLTLEPERFDLAYGVQGKPGNTKEGRAQIAGIVEAGKIPVKLADFDAAQAMAAAARNNSFMGHLLDCATHTEISVYWDDEIGGVVFPCKARLDIISDVPGFGIVVCDLKSAASASPEDMPKAIYNFGYHRQAAWYLHACRRIGIDARAFVLLAVEKESPHLTLAGTISDAAQCQGMAEIRDILPVYVDCLQTGIWPGYPAEVQELDLPIYAYGRDVA